MIRQNCFFLGLLLTLISSEMAHSAVIVSTNSTWKMWKGTNNLVSTAWRTPTFSESGWLEASAPFSYGLGLPRGTFLNDMRNLYSCVYLRTTFVVTNTAELNPLDINMFCDDGMIAWVNGREVLRFNMAEGAFNNRTPANSSLGQPPLWRNVQLLDVRGNLVVGTNVLAVQVFNSAIGGSDFGADLELVKPVPDTEAPRVTGISPAPGKISELSSLQIIFSEPVVGVEASDLRINDDGAVSVTGSGTTYTFSFAPQPIGPIYVRWGPSPAILDTARPPNAYDDSTGQWTYERVDLIPPTALSIHPPPSGTARSLTQIELLFSEPVTGVDASDLRVNGQPATNVTGFAAGPYIFRFPAAAPGAAQITWDASHGITDLAAEPNAFSPSGWSYSVNPSAVSPSVRINEILAANETGLADDDGDREDWIELHNFGATTADLEGWSLSDDANDPGKWKFSKQTIGPNGYLVVFASGKDRQPGVGGTKWHTNFKLSSGGDFLGLYNAESPRQLVHALSPEYPEQRNDHSYGYLPQANGFRYLQSPTPGAANTNSVITGICPPVHFSVNRGFFDAPFNLHLTCELPGAVIRYTIDGSVPTAQNGLLYTNAISIIQTRMIRAAAFATNLLPSRVETHTYLFNQITTRRGLPALSIVTASNNLYGRTGIMETSPRNTTQHGIAWERPVSAELIYANGDEGFQVDAGMRVQGGAYIRNLYNYRSSSPPQGKYSFRLYFRGDYGPSRLEYPLFGPLEVPSFDTIVLRAGMNDPTNPFIRDELMRRLAADTGQPAAHGMNASFYLNGAYKGYYNPTERIDIDFLRSWHGGEGMWDLIAQGNEEREGDGVEWNSLLGFMGRSNFAVAASYLEAARRLDVINFIDYALVNIYGATGDWPHNNWRAARERAPWGKFRFYIWDAEWAFGYNGRGVTHNTITTELAARETPVGLIYSQLRNSPEFRLTFADRVHKHLYNNGALTDTNVLIRFLELRTNMLAALPSMDTTIQRSWIPGRRGNILNHLRTAGLFASSNAPAFSQHGGRVPAGFGLLMTNMAGSIYYTTNGSDPRIPFSGAVAAEALSYAPKSLVKLPAGLTIKARSLDGTNWSALTEAAFQVAEAGYPIRITEIMYNPAGGDAYEFIELQNLSSAPVDLSFASWSGMTFAFPAGFILKPGGTAVLASSASPSAFASRYPNVQVAGYFDGSLSNGGERLVLKDRLGNTIVSVDYFDDGFWSAKADGGGHSLEIVDPWGDPDDPANWRASARAAGSPGTVVSQPSPASVVINEILASETSTAPNGGDWIELRNTSASAVDLGGWRLRDNGDEAGFVFPAGTLLEPGGHLAVWCGGVTSAPGLRAGFGLSAEGETLFLEDASGNPVDAVSYGLQIPGRSLVRLNGEWLLGIPTRGEENRAAEIGSASSLKINEWMANAMPGEDDWIELHNSDINLPVALRGMYLATSNSVFRIASHSFVAPGGFVWFRADENPGPDHLDFKLPAARGSIELRDAAATLVDRVAYGSQAEGVSQGRLPDGSNTLAAFAGSASPGASNYALQYSGPALNEIMALADPETDGADWVEIYHPGSEAANLGGMSLSIGEISPGQWVFPNGTQIAAKGYLVVWCDGGRPASMAVGPRLNTGRSIPREGKGVYLFNAAGQLVQKVDFGFQIPSHSIGMAGGNGWRLLAFPTPGSVNGTEALLASPASLRINEWMAAPKEGNDWFELHNPESFPMDLSGIYLTDDPSLSGQTNFQLGPLSFIPARGFQKFVTDNAAEDGNDHVNFSLDGLGEIIRIYTPARAPIDSVDFAIQREGVSQGRFPDGGTNIIEFPITPSPDESNYLPARVVINEVLAHTDPPLEDAIELFNPAYEAIPIGGWHLSDNASNLRKFRIPDGVVIPPGGFKVFYQHEFGASFSLNSAQGDEIFLSAADAAGNLTGHRSAARFPATENGVSIGRYRASAGMEFVALSERTFGADAPGSVENFRAGNGKPNAYPKVGPVVINEIMYHSEPLAGASGSGGENEEFIELHNLADTATPLFDPANPSNTWRARGGVEFEFAPGATIPARGFLLLVAFNPASDAAARAAFVNRHKPAPEAILAGPYRGQLNNGGESIELLKPDPPQTTGTDAGFVPYILVDRVSYGDALPWPTEPDLGFASLQKLRANRFGNDPLEWKGASPTAGRPNQTATDADTDGDGLPDVWETARGLDPNQSGDALLDADGDGVSNRDEYLSGSNPRDGSDRLRLALVSGSGGLPTLRFSTVPGKTYTLQGTDDPASGIWQEVQSIEGDSIPSVASVTDYIPRPGPSWYYRVVTPRQK